jgi:hypothetical protein
MNLKRTHKYRNLHLRSKSTLFFYIMIGTWEHIRIGEGSLRGKTESACFLHLGALEHHTHSSLLPRTYRDNFWNAL